MSLSSSIQLAANALQAQQIGLQVAGQNIANANTPGYTREEAIFAPAPTQRKGGLLLGLGVQVQAIKQKIDKFLDQRLWYATSDRASSAAQEDVYRQIESLVGELSDTDLSTSLNNFFSSISDVLNQPESVATRNLAVLRGKTLAQDFSRLAVRTQQLQSDVNDRIVDKATDINRLLDEVAKLNVRIVGTEAGDVSSSDAVGLRDQRQIALNKLAEIIDVRVQEQVSGAVNVYAGGDFLVFEGEYRSVEVAQAEQTDAGFFKATIRVADTQAALGAGSGELAGLLRSRDEILGGFLAQLDNFARTFAFEFNRQYASGQGLSGYQTLQGAYAAGDETAPLDAAGLEFTPRTGSFFVKVYNKQTQLTATTEIQVDLNGFDSDTSLNDLAAALDAVAGISAQIDTSRRLVLASDSSNLEFSFADDTSGALAALGLNTFFTGSTAADLGVSDVLLADPAKFAASDGGVGAGTGNAALLADFLDRPLDSAGGTTLSDLYDSFIGSLTQGSAVAHSVAEGFRTFEETLNGQRLATSGVSLDEEAVKLITYQRAFQATARYISTLSELLDLVANI